MQKSYMLLQIIDVIHYICVMNLKIFIFSYTSVKEFKITLVSKQISLLIMTKLLHRRNKKNKSHLITIMIQFTIQFWYGILQTTVLGYTDHNGFILSISILNEMTNYLYVKLRKIFCIGCYD